MYALNELGNPLDYVTTWNLTRDARELRNAAAVEVAPLAALRTSTSSGPTTDVRFVLEAMTQMMRTNSDALRLVTDSHVDLAKVLPSAKGMPRNLALPPSPIQLESADTADDEEDGGTEQNGDRLVEFGLGVVTLVNNLMAQFGVPKTNGSTASKPSTGLDLRSVFDWRHAAKKAQAREANATSLETAPSEVSDLASLLASLPMEVTTKLMLVRQKLDPEEQAGVMSLVMNIPKEDLHAAIADEQIDRRDRRAVSAAPRHACATAEWQMRWQPNALETNERELAPSNQRTAWRIAL